MISIIGTSILYTYMLIRQAACAQQYSGSTAACPWHSWLSLQLSILLFFFSAQVFWYLVEICEAWISTALWLTDLALIEEINVSWFIFWHVETISGELELALALLFLAQGCCTTSLSCSGPQYLSDLTHVYTPVRSLRSSSDTRILGTPNVMLKSYGQRSFAYQVPLHGIPCHSHSDINRSLIASSEL